MASFNAAVLTTKGIALLAKAQAGKTTIQFSALVTGNGSYSSGESITGRTALKSQKQSTPITSVSVVNDSTVYVKAIMSNADLTAGYYVKEAGLIAVDPTEGEILYAIATAVTDQWDYLPAYNGLLTSTITMEFYTEVTSAESVTITAGSGAYASAEDMEALTERVAALEQSTMRKYGVRRAVGASSPAWERLGGAVGLTAEVAVGTGAVQNDFMDSVYPYNKMKPCNLAADGTVSAYLGDADFDWYGTNGDDVMLEVPAYYSERYIKTEDGVDYEYRWISSLPADGMELDPLFLDGDTAKDRAYIPIFHASLSDDGTTIRSVAGAVPLGAKSRYQMRTLATAKGTGWSLTDVWSAFALEHLYLIMYANSNSQAILGSGRTGYTLNNNWTALYTVTGNTVSMLSTSATNFSVGQLISIGTSTGGSTVAANRTITAIEDSTTGGESLITFDGDSVTVSAGNVLWACPQKTGETIDMESPNGQLVADAKHAVRFLWVEDWFGNINEWLDGDNILDGQHYLAHDRTQYADATYDGAYSAVGYISPTTGGYIREKGMDDNEPMAAIPYSVSGSVTTYYCDYYNGTSGARAPCRGGGVSNGTGAGAFNWNCDSAASASRWSIGGRPLYK